MASTSSPPMEEPPFPCPSGVNVADSVTIKLCPTNYFAWKQLMLRFLESRGLSGFVDGAINPREEPPPLWESSLLLEARRLDEEETREKKRQEDWNQQHMQQEGKTLVDWVQEEERKEWEEHRIYRGWKRSDDLVRGWIVATMREELLPRVMYLVTAQEVWTKLEKILTPAFQPSHRKLYVPPIKSVRETKLLHYQALNLVKRLYYSVEETDLLNAAEILIEPLRNATCVGIHEIVEEILESFPSAIHLKSETDPSLFHLAIVYRRENVFNLIYQMEEDQRAILSMPDASTNNALHLAGNLTPQQQLLLRASAPGAALQMQRELQWFEEVGKWMLPQAKEHMNAEGKTPQEVFTETHKDLVKEGERWMKDTANSCTIVAALITTIVFAAAITVPGGSFSDSNSDKKGLPIRLGGRAFTVFGVSDALAMFSSSASLFMFLSILTCRYGEEDFRYSLPRRLIIGLVTLFISIISMMVAFGATLKIVFGEKKAWIVVPVAILSCVPVTLFALLQFPLLCAIIKSTYLPGIFGKKSNRILY